MPVLTVLLVIAAILGGIAGFNYLSQATLGIGIIGIACLCGILGRIAQASVQHDQLLGRDIKEEDVKRTEGRFYKEAGKGNF